MDGVALPIIPLACSMRDARAEVWPPLWVPARENSSAPVPKTNTPSVMDIYMQYISKNSNYKK